MVTLEIRVANKDQLDNTVEEAVEGVIDDVMPADDVSTDGQEQHASSGDVNAEVERLQEELQDAKDQALRAVAEMQNVRRRAEQDVAKAHKFGLEKFVGDMVVVADNLERSVTAMADENVDLTVLKEGIDLTLKSLVDGLKRHHVEAIDPEGTPFDPQLHQAMAAVEQADVEPNTVLNVYQKGYTLHGRLVRPAMVVVSKATAS
mgnify:CR=1 FL=1